jgi:hypothetical protein
MLHEFFENFLHNLFKPLLLFFYFGFLLRIFKVDFEFPYVIYQGLTMYLLIAIGWHGGEELAEIKASSIAEIVGFLVTGFLLNVVIGLLAYLLLSRLTALRQVDKATVAGYYGSDSAGTFATCVAVPLAVMEIPGCLVALYLVARLRHRGMDVNGNMPNEPGYVAPIPANVGPGAATQPASGQELDINRDQETEERIRFALTKRKRSRSEDAEGAGEKQGVLSRKLLREVFLNPGLCLLFGGIVIGFVSRLQGHKVTHDADSLFIAAFQGVLCLFLLEMGMTAASKLRDLRVAGRGFIFFGLLAPNLFAPLGIVVAHAYAYLTHTDLELGTYVLFAVLCGAASYIAVPAVQRLAIPEASPTLPLAASLGLTFSYNVTIGIPLYVEISRIVGHWFGAS